MKTRSLKHSDKTVTIDLEADHLSRHRTCWKHAESNLRVSRKRITKKQAEELESFKNTCPCFSETFPRRERSRRKFKSRTVVYRLEKKLSTKAFEHFLRNLWTIFSEDQKLPFTYLDSLWFTMYKKTSTRSNVLEWIKRKSVFSKKYIFVPIVCWDHWSLLILCDFGESLESEGRKPFMLLLDSLKDANPRRLEPDIRKFVLDIYKSEDRAENKQLISQIPLLVPKVPQQRNDVECGNYVLYFINLFVRDANNFSREEYPGFMKDDWFTPESLDTFCLKLESLQSEID